MALRHVTRRAVPMNKCIRPACGREFLTLLTLVLAAAIPALGCGGDDDAGDRSTRDGGPRGGEDDDAGTRPAQPVAGRGSTGEEGGDMDGGTSSEADAGNEDGSTGDDALAFRDLSIQMTDMTSVVDSRINFELVSATGLEAVALLDPLPAEDYTFTIPDFVPAGGHELQFFADVDGMAGKTAGDETWAVDVPTSGDPAVIEFDYVVGDAVTGANPAADAADLRFTSNGLVSYQGDQIEIRLVEEETGQVVGLYRGVVYLGAEFARTFFGVVRDRVKYRIDIWVDADRDGRYDAPPTDSSWSKSYTGTGADASYVFMVDDDYTPLAP
jgi:hypothetical protein